MGLRLSIAVGPGPRWGSVQLGHSDKESLNSYPKYKVGLMLHLTVAVIVIDRVLVLVTADLTFRRGLFHSKGTVCALHTRD